MSESSAEIASPNNSLGNIAMPANPLPPFSSPADSLNPFEDQFQTIDISDIDFSDADACPVAPFFIGANRQAVLDEVEHLCQFSHNLVTVLADTGMGKTAVAYQAAIELSDTADCCVMEASVFNSTENMLLILAQQLGVFVPEDATIDVMVAALSRYQPVGTHQNVVIIIDAAHHLHESALQVFMQFLQQPAPNFFHVLLVGETTLQIKLDKLDKQGVLVYDVPLRALNEDEVGQYVDFKLAQTDYQGAELFTSDAIQQLWKESGGVPALINQIARKMLLVDSGIGHDERNLGLPIGYMAIVVLLLAALILAVFYIDDTPTVTDEELVSALDSQIGVNDPALLLDPDQTKNISSVDSLESNASSLSVTGQSDANIESVTNDIPAADTTNAAESPVTEKANDTESSFSVVEAAPENGLSPEIIAPVVSSSSSSDKPPAPTIKLESTPQQTISAPVVVVSKPVAPVKPRVASDVLPNNSQTKGEAAIMSWPADGYTLQVMAAGQLGSINQFVRSQSNRDLLRVITLRRSGAPWYVVFSGVYESREEARLAIASLPEVQKNTQPWPRQISDVQKDIADFRNN